MNIDPPDPSLRRVDFQSTDERGPPLDSLEIASKRLKVRGYGVSSLRNRAIGVSPKWLIRCFRLQDALQALETGLNVNLAALAQDLGYFDQAHFTRDFKQITGVTPGRY
jgi:AraC-like DNA-binding protein